MRKIIFKLNWLIAIAFLLVISSTSTAYGQEYTPIPIAINGHELPLEAGAVNYKGINMIPLKLLKDICGYELYWEDSIKAATMLKDNEYIRVSLGNTIATVNGKTTYMKEAPLIIEGRILVPLDFLAENTNLEVYWSPINRKVNVYDPQLKSNYSVEIQARLKNRIINSIDRFERQAIKKQQEQLIELIVFEDLKDVNLDQDFLSSALAYSLKSDKSVGGVREVQVKENPKNGNPINPKHNYYKIGEHEKYKIEVSTGKTPEVVEMGEEFSEKEHLPIESEDYALLETQIAKNDLFKNEGIHIINVNRWYNSVESQYQTVINSYVDTSNLNLKNFFNSYPSNQIIEIKPDRSNHMEVEVRLNQGTDDLRFFGSKALLLAKLSPDYCTKMGLDKDKYYWVYVLNSNNT